MTYPLPWLNVLAFSGCRLARCCSVESMMITIFQGSPLSRVSVLANCRACVLERLSSVVMATLECDCNIFERSEEHTSELQSLAYLVCRLLLEKKKKIITQRTRNLIPT